MTESNSTRDALLKREKIDFFSVRPDRRGRGRPGFTIPNLSKLPLEGNVLEPKYGSRGFSEYSELPLLRLDKTLGGPLRDIEPFHAYWLVSKVAKEVFTSVDPEGFAFVKCNVFTEHWEPGPEYWLCDVIIVLDAVDDAKSSIKIEHDSLGKRYSFIGVEGEVKLVFRHEVIGSAHIFRLSYHTLSAVFCDRRMKDACKSAGLKGIKFGKATGSK